LPACTESLMNSFWNDNMRSCQPLAQMNLNTRLSQPVNGSLNHRA
jgi:hypothetical protein